MPLSDYLDNPDQPPADPKAQDQNDVATALHWARVNGDNPDSAAKVVKLSDATGIPPGTVHRNQQQVQQLHDAQSVDVHDIVHNYPSLATYLKDPKNAAVSADDLHNLKGLEENIRTHGFWSNALRGTASEVNRLVGNLLQWGGTLGEGLDKAMQQHHIPNPGIVINNDGISWSWNLNEPQNLSDLITGQVPSTGTPNMLTVEGQYLSQAKAPRMGYQPDFTWEKFKGDPTPTNLAGFIVEQGLGALPDIAMTMSLETLPAYIASYDESIAKERSANDARTVTGTGDLISSIVPATAAALLMHYGVGKVLSAAPAATIGGIAKTIGIRGLEAGGVAAGLGVADYLAGRVDTRHGPTVGETVDRALAGFVGAAPIGALAGGARATWDAVGSRVRQQADTVAQSMSEQARIDNIIRLTQQSTTNMRAQDRFREFLRGAGKDNALYVPAPEVARMASEGVQVPDWMARQAVGDGDVVMPMDRFATEVVSDPQLLDAVRPHVRMSPRSLSADELTAGTDQSLRDIMETAAKAQETNQQVNDIYDQVKDQLVGTGRQSESTARWSAALYPAYITSFIERARQQGIDITPKQAFEQFLGVKVVGPDYQVQPAVNRLDQANAKAEFRAPQAGKTLDELYASAPANQTQLNDTANSIAGAVEGVQYEQPPGESGGIKSLARTQEKITNDYGGDAGMATDIVRGGFRVNTPAAADQVVSELAKQFPVLDLGWKRGLDGYFDRKVLVRFGDQVGEVQLWEPSIFDAKAAEGHRLYEEARMLPPGDPRIAELHDQMKALYDGMAKQLPPEWQALIQSAEGSAGASGKAAEKSALESWSPSRNMTVGLMGTQAEPSLGSTQANAPLDTAGLPPKSQKASDLSISGSIPDISKLQQSAQTETPAFKRWFGDSKVVDDSGKPLVVYHTSTFGDFNVFNKAEQRKGVAGFGFYFSDRAGSNIYADYGQNFQADRNYRGDEKAVKTMPVYLSIKHPLVVNDLSELSRFGGKGDFGTSRDIARVGPDEKGAIERAGYDGVIFTEYVKRQRNGSYDVVSRGTPGAISHPVYVAFEPDQIKSAIGNRGTFEPGNPSIVEQQGGAEPRGQLHLMTNERIIQLGRASDLSTFLHESGHLFLEAEKQFADLYGVSDTQKALLDWLGAKSFEDVNAQTPEGVAKHEQFARGFEAYLMEGKAPSLKLRDAFAAFKQWLLNIYQHVSNLDVNLNDNIRQVFDRLLATQSDIIEATHNPAYDQYFRTKEQAGMSDAEWQSYLDNVERRKNRASETVDDKLMKAYREQRTREWNQERQPLIDEETARLQDEPVYQLLGDLKDAPLDWQRVVDAYDGQMPAKLQGKLIGKARKENGVDPEIYAQKYGFDSVRQMLDSVQEAPSLKDAATAAAQQRMIEKHGDILNDGSLQAEVEEALHNNAEADVLLAEIKALKPKSAQLINRDYLQAEAKRVIGQMTFKEIQPGKYFRAEIRAAQRATAARADQHAEAYDAKVQQLANHYLYREAVEARRQFVTSRRYIRGVQNREYSVRAVPPEYQLLLKTTANMYFLKNRAQQAADVNHVLDWYLGQMTNNAFDVAIFDPNLARALEARLTNTMDQYQLPEFDSLTLEDVKGVEAMLRHIRHVGGKYGDEQAAQIALDRNSLVQSIADNGGRDITDPTTPHRMPPGFETLKYLWNTLPSLFNQIRSLDNSFESNKMGEAERLIYRPVEDGWNNELELKNRVYEMFRNELDAVHHIGLSTKDLPPVTLASGRKLRLNTEELFMMATYWGTETSREAIREGYQITDGEVLHLLGQLTPDQLNLVNAVWRVNEQIAPELFGAAVKRYGVAPEKLQPTPFEVNGVTMTGGYMQLRYNSLELDVKTEQQLGEQYGSVMPGKASSLIERIGSGGRPVLLDKNNIIRMLEENIHFIAFAEAAQKVSRIVNARDVSAMIQRRHGRPFYSALMDQLSKQLRGRSDQQGRLMSTLGNVARFFRRAAIAKNLAFSIRNTIQQFTSLPIVMDEVGVGPWVSSVFSILSNPHDTIAMINDKSVFMRNRASLVNRESAEYLNTVTMESGTRYMWHQFQQLGFAPQTFIDGLFSYPTWLAKYQKALHATGDERQAVSQANRAVAESVGTGLDLHLGSALNSKNPEIVKLFTVFGSYFNNYYQRMYRDTNGFTKVRPAGVKTVIFTPMLAGALSALLVMDYPNNQSKETWWEWMLREYASFAGGTIPLLRDILSVYFNHFGAETVMTQALKAPAKVPKQTQEVIDAFIKQDGQTSKLKASTDVLRTVSTIYPIPGAGEIARMADFVDTYNHGQEGPLTPLKAYQAVTEGPDYNKRR